MISRKLRLAVIFDQPTDGGGAYQQALNAVMLTRGLSEISVSVEYFITQPAHRDSLAGFGIQSSFIKLPPTSKFLMYARMKIRSKRILRFVRKLLKYSKFESILVSRGTDLVYFVTPNPWANCLEELNFITTVWDLSHRDDPEFPEVRFERELENRDLSYQSSLPRAVAVFVDSELGKGNVVKRYGVDRSRVHVMPFQASIAARKEAELNKGLSACSIGVPNSDFPYVFYPAQFWAHKNHVYILEGLKILEERFGKKVGAIFSGGDRGNLNYVNKNIKALGLEDRIKVTGFVSDDDIVDLYKRSLAMVMPTYFGPTNLPPLEAFHLGVPVLYSDKEGLRDQVGDAALLLDLNDPFTLASNLNALIEDDTLRKTLIAKGFERLQALDSVNRIQILQAVVDDFRRRRLTWA